MAPVGAQLLRATIPFWPKQARYAPPQRSFLNLGSPGTELEFAL